MDDPWFEGNNILFVGQLLAYLRDVESTEGADEALRVWFNWLDDTVDPKTGLWGVNSEDRAFEAMCGGYHQLLMYYYENHAIQHEQALVDTVLGLQHTDGGFSPAGGGGACEDVDAVDILVNAYKRTDYRRADIRHALRRCLRLILTMQNEDGGFCYKRGMPYSHMGIPATFTEPGGSAMFPTWFRVHTLALIAEILTDEPALAGIPFRFSSAPSMGWHRPWDKDAHQLRLTDRLAELPFVVADRLAGAARAGRRLGARVRGRMSRFLMR